VVLLDRDGTIIEDRDYLNDPEGVTLLPAAVRGLRRLAQGQRRLVVLTNQSGVASGRIDPANLLAVHHRLNDLLNMAGVTLEGIYICPHGSDEGCSCRKPEVGLAQRAAAELGFDLSQAAMIGDKPSDLALARRLGIPAILVTTGKGEATEVAGASADYVVDSLDEAADLLLDPAGLVLPVSLTPELR
jgi:histidinol-phosphate phosphatase family protein